MTRVNFNNTRKQSIDIQCYDSMHLYFVNITVNARLIKNRLFFLYGFSSFHCTKARKLQVILGLVGQ